MEQLLATKLYIPLIRPKVVARPRLIERLLLGLGRKLTLISAPAGFGKTTLVTELLDGLQGDSVNGQQSEFKVAWLSLDKDDNDRARFLTYLIAALRKIEPNLAKGMLSAVQSPQTPSNEVVLITLINEIAGNPERTLLVLDDYHLIDAQPVHDALQFLVENVPPQMHVMIATREDPLLPLSRLRVRGQLTELRATDLRFTPDEAAEFLNKVMGLDLSDEQVAALERRTEGWIAGLQLAAISMQGSEDADNFVKSFTGSNRYILDYLIEEVLEQCSQEVQSFLMQTSLLDRLSGPLCEAITGQAKGGETLEELEHTNLFIIPLDHERLWYRYHQLFQDLLQRRLQQKNPDQIQEIHHRASVWFESNSFSDEAVEHALLGKDFKRSTGLLAELADALWERGEHEKLRRWLVELPGEWLCAETLLCLYHAWFVFSTDSREAAEGILRSAEAALADDIGEGSNPAEMGAGSTSAAKRIKLRGRISAVRALIASWGNDATEIIQLAGTAMENLPVGDPWRGMAAITLGDAYYFQGDLQASYRSRLETQEATRGASDLFLDMIANLKVATSLRELGRLNETIEICRQQVEFAKQNGLTQTKFTGWALGLWGIALAEQDDLETALKYTARSVELTRGGDLAFVGFSYMMQAKTQYYRGEFAKAESTLNELAEMAHQHYLPHYITGALAAWQARLDLAQNRMDAALQKVEASGLNFDGKISLTYDDMHLVYIRILLSEGKFEGIPTLLEPWLAAAEQGEFIARAIEICILVALAYRGMDDMPRAVETIRQSLRLAEPGGYVRYFVDEGPPMAGVLYEALSQGIAPDYIRRLLAAFPEAGVEEPEAQGEQASLPDWIEPLSERELEVLELIAEGFTNPEIGERLYLSLNTVKVHTRNIYGKLGVNNRTSAVSKARALGILSQS